MTTPPWPTNVNDQMPTPETDAVWEAYQKDPHGDNGDPWGLASKLERQRDEARRLFESSKRARKSLSEACNHLQQKLDNTISDVCHALGALEGEDPRLAAMRVLAERDELAKALRPFAKMLGGHTYISYDQVSAASKAFAAVEGGKP